MRQRQFLSGARIYLRNLERSDVEGNYGYWLNDPEVCRFNAHHRFPYAKGDLADYIEGLRGADDRLVLAIIDREGDQHVGNISLQSIDRGDLIDDFLHGINIRQVAHCLFSGFFAVAVHESQVVDPAGKRHDLKCGISWCIDHDIVVIFSKF